MTSKDQGVNTIVQCVMADPSGRIKFSTIRAMATMMLTLTCLYEEADLERHPRICIIFNNVSNYKY